MEVIALRGKHDSGKTTTITLIHQLLLQRGYRSVPGFPRRLGRGGDFMDIVEKGKQRIGLVTRGDIASWLNQDLQTINNANCQKCVCACRSYGRTVQVVMGYPHHLFVLKTISGQSLHGQSNLNDANRIIAIL